MNKTVLGIIVLLVVVGLIFLFATNVGKEGPRESAFPTTQQPAGTVAQGEPPVTGSVDDVATAITRDTTEDLLPVAGDDGAFLSEDDTALNDFGRSFDASQF